MLTIVYDVSLSFKTYEICIHKHRKEKHKTEEFKTLEIKPSENDIIY